MTYLQLESVLGKGLLAGSVVLKRPELRNVNMVWEAVGLSRRPLALGSGGTVFKCQDASQLYLTSLGLPRQILLMLEDKPNYTGHVLSTVPGSSQALHTLQTWAGVKNCGREK